MATIEIRWHGAATGKRIDVAESLAAFEALAGAAVPRRDPGAHLALSLYIDFGAVHAYLGAGPASPETGWRQADPDPHDTVLALFRSRWWLRYWAADNGGLCWLIYWSDVPGGGEGAVLAAAQTAITRSPPAALGGHEPAPYRVARTTHHERRPGCPSGRRAMAVRGGTRTGVREVPPRYRLFVGVDSAATTATVAWQGGGSAPSRPCTIDQTPQGFAALQRRLLASGLAPAEILVVLEATGSYWRSLATCLGRQVRPVRSGGILAPSATPHPAAQ
jgi:hypothetical protein